MTGIVRAALAVGILIGCQKNTVRKEVIGMRAAVIIPTSNCTDNGLVTLTVNNDEQMVCEMQPRTGSHVARCACVPEGFTDKERELAFQQLRSANPIHVCGGTVCMPGVVEVANH